jgi:hypothetical protein
MNSAAGKTRSNSMMAMVRLMDFMVALYRKVKAPSMDLFLPAGVKNVSYRAADSWRLAGAFAARAATLHPVSGRERVNVAGERMR